MIYIFWSCSNEKEAKKIIYDLLDQKLIACASILPEILSIYRWQEKIEENKEVKVILKTLPHLFLPIETLIQEKSSYQVPEIVQIEVSKVNPSYLSWIEQNVL